MYIYIAKQKQSQLILCPPVLRHHPRHQIFMGISHTGWDVLRKRNWSHNPVQANKDKQTHQNNNSSLQTKSTHYKKGSVIFLTLNAG